MTKKEAEAKIDRRFRYLFADCDNDDETRIVAWVEEHIREEFGLAPLYTVVAVPASDV